MTEKKNVECTDEELKEAVGGLKAAEATAPEGEKIILTNEPNEEPSSGGGSGLSWSVKPAPKPRRF